MALRAAIIGCGRRGPAFAKSCLAAGDVQMVGFADPVPGAAAKVAEEFGGKAFTDTAAMLAATKPDFVCLITRPNVRLGPVELCAKAGVKALLCEKPMATSWGEARALHHTAVSSGMKLSFCHQRRVNPQYLLARQMIRDGAIGKARHIIGYCGNMYDWGTHWFDMMHCLNNETEAQWVMAQVQRDNPSLVFDQPMDRRGVSVVRFANEVMGTLQTGEAQGEWTSVRVIGEAGTLRVTDKGVPNVPALEVVTAKGSVIPDIDYGDLGGVDHGVLHAIEALRRGVESELSSAHALRASQLIFASYHSALVGGPVSLPLPTGFDLKLTDVFKV